MASHRYKQFYISLTLTLASFLQGCALTLLNIATPTAGYVRTSDIPYGDKSRQSLDIYEPSALSSKTSNNSLNGIPNNTPNQPDSYDKNITLVFFYGGAWDSGNKDLYRFVGRAFALEGYRVIIPDYRVYPEVKFPEFVNDSALAIKKISAMYPDQQFVLIGHSAGAHITALLATDPDYLAKVSVPSRKIKAWVGWSGPYDFLPLTSRRIKAIFSGDFNIEKTQPIFYAGPSDPPALLTHGTKDTRVLLRNSKNMAKKLTDSNVNVIEKYYEGKTHSNTLVSASTLFRDVSPSFKDTIEYLSGLKQKKEQEQ